MSQGYGEPNGPVPLPRPFQGPVGDRQKDTRQTGV